MTKLTQIKEFTKENITNEIAFQIFAIGGLWRSYLSKERKERGFTVKERWYGKCDSGSSHKDEWNNPNHTEPNYTRTFQGLLLKPLCGTSHEFYLNADGKLTCYNIHQKGELKSFYTGNPAKDIPASEEFYEEFSMKLEYPANQIELIQLYLDLGFYTIK